MIRCREIYNCYCLRCKAIDLKMVRVGPMHFCYDCFKDIFDDQENFDLKSEQGKQYFKWLKTYKESHF